MPYTPTTPSLLLCADLAALTLANWTAAAGAAPNPSDGVSGVNWSYFSRFAGPDDPNLQLKGRQVEFYPTGDYDRKGMSRGQMLYTHHVSCLVVERYTLPGDVTRDWWSQRVDFVHQFVAQDLWFSQHGPAPFNPALRSLEQRVQVCDLEKLLSRNKLFYAYVELDFEEVVTLPSSP